MKPYMLAVPFIALFAGAAVAAAPEAITQEITVTAVIPGNDFSVEPKGDWIQKGVTLEYQPEGDAFKKVTEAFKAQSDVGAIQAALIEPAVLVDQASDQRIDLAIIVGDKPLTLSPEEVMSAADAKVGNDLPISFDAIKPATGYVKGDYNGVVKVLFETASSSL